MRYAPATAGNLAWARERVRVRQAGPVVKVRANRAGVPRVTLRAPKRADKVVVKVAVKVRASTTGRADRTCAPDVVPGPLTDLRHNDSPT